MVIDALRRELKGLADAKLRAGGERFFKEPVKLYGIRAPMVRAIGKRYWAQVKTLGKPAVFALCETLWRSGMLEEAFVACQWSYAVRREYAPADFKLFERWVARYVSNWAACDTFCNHTVGDFLERFPVYLPRLLVWAGSRNRWLRRAAAVSLIVPARRGKFQAEIFRVADRLRTDEDDLVQKGYGWMLKAASQADPGAVFAYVLAHRAGMPRTALRYAIEKLPPAWKTRAMQRDAKPDR